MFPALSEFLYFVQAWHAASKLLNYLDCMDVPVYRKDVSEVHNLQWLSRNLQINNSEHHLYPEARRLLQLLFNDSRYRALKAVMWRCEVS